LIDRYGREVRGLRVSLTQRCNLNCVYCHHEGETSPISEMTSKEVLRIVRVAKSLGVRRVKYTGGEPLLREDLSEIIHGTLALDLEDVAITTNGTLLKRQVDSLAVAGLRRLNVSLPSIRPCVYTSLTEGQFSDVFEAFRKQVLALDPCVTEEFLKLYVAYKAETNFVDVIPQKKRLVLMFNMAFPEISDPKGICRDVTGMGRWGNGDVEVAVASLDGLPYVMGLVRQSLEKQLGNGTDAG